MNSQPSAFSIQHSVFKQWEEDLLWWGLSVIGFRAWIKYIKADPLILKTGGDVFSYLIQS